MVTELDLTAFEVNQDPASFASAALDGGPVQWSEHHRAWLVLSHAAVSEGFRDQRLSADRIEPLQRLAIERPDEFGLAVELLSGWMIFRIRRPTPTCAIRSGGRSRRGSSMAFVPPSSRWSMT